MSANENRDIIARIGRSNVGSNSTGALAAHLSRACGHVLVDSRVIQQGYQFHAELSDEIPAFFNRRMSTGATKLAVTLQGGVDPDAELAARGPFTGHDNWAIDPFETCKTTKDARIVIEAEDYHASIWLVRITMGMRSLTITEIADPLFIAQYPNEFRLLAEELISIGLLQIHTCSLCGD